MFLKLKFFKRLTLYTIYDKEATVFILFNNFTDLLCINYFNYNIAKYSKNLVNNALKAVLLLLNKEQMGACTVLKYIISSILLI